MSQNKPRELLRGDPTRCAWCREYRPQDGVVKVKRVPERIHSDEGKLLGLEGEVEYLFFHPKCFDDYKGDTFKERIGSVLCKYCENWKMKSKSKMPSGLYCICQCHPALGKQVIKECKILDLKEMEEGLEIKKAQKAEEDRLRKLGQLKEEKKPDIIDKPTGQTWVHGVDIPKEDSNDQHD